MPRTGHDAGGHIPYRRLGALAERRMIAPQNHNDHVFMVDVRTEIEWARERYSNVSSLHEGYSVILEELDEFWEEVKKKPQARTASAMHKELVQVAAMAMRTASDVVARYER